MIDDPFASVRPRRRTTPAAAPVVDDDPFASVAPRDTLNTYIRNTTAPEPQREPFLSRLGSAAKALGQQAIEHPIETAKGIGKGLLQNASDLAAFSPVGVTLGMPQRIVAEEGGDRRRALLRAGGAASLLLSPGMRAVGAPLGVALGADYLASAGLGAAQTPDDPAVGAALGLAMNAVADSPRAMRAVRGGIDAMQSVTNPFLSDGQRGPLRFPSRVPITNDAAKIAQTIVPGKVVDRLAEPYQMRTEFDAPTTPPRPGTTERFPEGYTAEPKPPLVAEGALDRVFPEVRKSFDPRSADEVFVQPTPREATPERFPDGYSAEPPDMKPMVVDIPSVLGLSARETRDLMRTPVEDLRGALDGLTRVESPTGPVAPRADILFGDDRAFTMPDLPKPKKSVIPSSLKPSAVVDDAVGSASAPVQSRAPLPERVPQTSTLAPEPAAAALDAPLTPPAAAAIPEVPPARVDAPVEPPAPVAAAVEPTPPPVAADTPLAGPADAVTAPSKDATVNWKTWFDPASPGSQTAEARLRSVIANDPDLVKNARGYESMAVTDAKATAAMKELVAELTDDPLAADLPGIRAFVQKHGAAGVPAMKKLIAQNEQALQDASRVVANGGTAAEMELAMQVIDGIERQQADLLRGTVKEQANLGRGLNALKLRAKMSTDPDVWLVQAQRSLGDVPMTDAVRNEVRRLARVAADACGGA